MSTLLIMYITSNYCQLYSFFLQIPFSGLGIDSIITDPQQPKLKKDEFYQAEKDSFGSLASNKSQSTRYDNLQEQYYDKSYRTEETYLTGERRWYDQPKEQQQPQQQQPSIDGGQNTSINSLAKTDITEVHAIANHVGNRSWDSVIESSTQQNPYNQSGVPSQHLVRAVKNSIAASQHLQRYAY